jgi:hypothetical protein
MIEKGMAQGLKETYATFVEILGRYAPHLDKDALTSATPAAANRTPDSRQRRRGSRLELLSSDLSDDGQDLDAFVESASDEARISESEMRSYSNRGQFIMVCWEFPVAAGWGCLI